MSLTIHDYEQRSEEWYAARRGIVTASAVGQLITSRSLTAAEFECPDCAAAAYAPCISKRDSKPIATMHPARTTAAKDDDSDPILEPARNDYSKALTLTLVAERITGITEESYITADMWRGIESEPIARDLYSEHFAPATEVGFMVRDEPTWTLGYSPDGLVGEHGLIEIKAPRAKTHIATILADEVPARHMAQVQAGLLVSGREWLDFCSYHGGLPLFVKRVTPDLRWFDAITAAVEQFETTASEMVAAYTQATKDMPATERVLLEYGVIQ